MTDDSERIWLLAYGRYSAERLEENEPEDEYVRAGMVARAHEEGRRAGLEQAAAWHEAQAKWNGDQLERPQPPASVDHYRDRVSMHTHAAYSLRAMKDKP